MRLTSSRLSGRTSSTRPCMRRSNPSRIPRTSTPCSSARMVAALITLLIPGAGPPPTKMASFSFDTSFSFFPRTVASRGRYGADLNTTAAARTAEWCVEVNRVTRSLLRFGRRQRRLDHLDLPGDLGPHPGHRLDVQALAQVLDGGGQAGQAQAGGGVDADVGIGVIEQRAQAVGHPYPAQPAERHGGLGQEQ